MPSCSTRYFGTLEYTEDSALEFPRGLPGYEQEHRFVAIDHPGTKPLVYLQSLDTEQLCFVALPAQLVAPDFELQLSEDDIGAIGLDNTSQPQIGTDVLCLTLVSIRETGATVNLMAPVVASLRSRKAVQAICGVGRYSHQHPLGN